MAILKRKTGRTGFWRNLSFSVTTAIMSTVGWAIPAEDDAVWGDTDHTGIGGAGSDVDNLWADVSAYIGEIYVAAAGIITVLSALLLMWAFIIIMTGTQQKAQAAKDWAKRVIVGYICFNCMGLLFRIIGQVTGGFTM